MSENFSKFLLIFQKSDFTGSFFKGFNLNTYQQFEKNSSSTKKWCRIYHRGQYRTPCPCTQFWLQPCQKSGLAGHHPSFLLVKMFKFSDQSWYQGEMHAILIRFSNIVNWKQVHGGIFKILPFFTFISNFSRDLTHDSQIQRPTPYQFGHENKEGARKKKLRYEIS